MTTLAQDNAARFATTRESQAEDANKVLNHLEDELCQARTADDKVRCIQRAAAILAEMGVRR